MSRPRILVVDGDNAFREYVCTVLSDADYETTQLGAGDEAVRWLTETKVIPSLIILDMDLGDPRWNGLQICHWLKERPRLRKIPVIIATGMPENDHQREARAVHSNRFLSKPFSRNTLLKTINELLHHEPSRRDAAKK